MNQIKILFLIAIIIQTGTTESILINKDDSLINTKTLFCFEICFKCFSNKPSYDLYEVVNNLEIIFCK